MKIFESTSTERRVMDKRTESLTTHPIWDKLKTLGLKIDHAVKLEGIEATTIADIERIRNVLDFIGKRLSGFNASLYFPGVLDQIEGQVEAAINDLSQFAETLSLEYLDKANVHTDNIVKFSTTVPHLSTLDEHGAFNDFTKQYQQTIINLLKEVEQKNRGTKATVTSLINESHDLSAAITAEKTRLDKYLLDFQNSFLTAQESRSTDHQRAQASFTERFNTIFDDYKEKIVGFENDYDKAKLSILTDIEGKLSKLDQNYSDKAIAICEEIERKKIEVEKLVGVIGNLGISSGFTNAANEARADTRKWQYLTIIAFIVVISITCYSFFPAISGDVTWSGLFARVTLTLTVAAFAAYSAFQADKYLEIEKRNRKYALEFEAIGPYLSPLPQDDQNKFRLQLASLSFGQNDSPFHKGNRSPTNIFDLLLQNEQGAEVLKAALLKYFENRTL